MGEPSEAHLTVGGRYGRVGVEILRGSDCVAVVGRMQANRLDSLDKVRSAKATRGEPAHFAEAEAQELERFEALGLARQFAASGDLLEAVKDYLEWGAMTGSDSDLFAARFRAAVAKAEGRVDSP